jgi:phospholipid transport system transporter-binding protein
MSHAAFKPSNALTFDTVSVDLSSLRAYVQGSQSAVLCLDLSDVTLCDSAGLALLIAAKRLCKQQKKTLVLENMPKAVEALAQFCGVDALLSKP